MWIIYSLLAALSAAIVVVLSKAGLKDVDSNSAFAIQSVMILMISWAAVWWQGAAKDLGKIDGKAWFFLLAAGIVTCVSSLLNFKALKLGEASQAGSLSNVSLVFSITLAVLFLKERLTWQIVLGGLLMAGGAIVISLSSKAAEQ